MPNFFTSPYRRLVPFFFFFFFFFFCSTKRERKRYEKKKEYRRIWPAKCGITGLNRLGSVYQSLGYCPIYPFSRTLLASFLLASFFFPQPLLITLLQSFSFCTASFFFLFFFYAFFDPAVDCKEADLFNASRNLCTWCANFLRLNSPTSIFLMLKNFHLR